VPQAAFQRPFHIEHIIARQHGGKTESDNLALACWQCNFKKGPNLSGIDPETAQVTPLFHPREDTWADHFEVLIETLMPLGIEIRGLTPVGLTNFGERRHSTGRNSGSYLPSSENANNTFPGMADPE
jgi:hypothetical protein